MPSALTVCMRVMLRGRTIKADDQREAALFRSMRTMTPKLSARGRRILFAWYGDSL